MAARLRPYGKKQLWTLVKAWRYLIIPARTANYHLPIGMWGAGLWGGIARD